MVRAFVVMLLCAWPAWAEPLPDQSARLERLRGTTIDLFTRPTGPDPKAAAEPIWQLSFAPTATPGVFEATLTSTWRGKEAVPALAPPPPHTFKLVVSFGGCGSAHLKAAALDNPKMELEVTSHLTRVCDDDPVNDMLVVLREGPKSLNLFSAPAH